MNYREHSEVVFSVPSEVAQWLAGLIADSVLYWLAKFQQGMRLLDRE